MTTTLGGPRKGTEGRWRARRLLRALVAFYALALAAALLLLYPFGDHFWMSTLLLLGPRGVLALPLPVLAAAGAALDRQRLWLLAVLGLVLVGPVLGFRVPLRLPPFPRPDPRDIRVMSYNIGGGEFDRSAFESVLEEALPDVVALQECSGDLLKDLKGWQLDMQYDSCLLSRFPIVRVVARDPSADVWKMGGRGVIVRYELATPSGPVHLVNLHLVTAREGLEDLRRNAASGIPTLEAKNAQREIEARLAQQWVKECPGPARLVTGDFNMPVESDVYRTYWAEYQNAFSVAGFGFGFTKHTRFIRVRIDHILASPGWLCVRAWVGPWLDFDHRPIIAILRWQGSGGGSHMPTP